jgi:hypothetical protein
VVGKTNVWMGVKVASGVYVLRGVAVKVAVAVEVGMAASVWTEAASEVCNIYRFTALGSSGGMGVGVTKVGTHETIKLIMIEQRKNLVFGKVICLYDFLDASNRAALQPDFDPMGMRRGFGENLFHHPSGQSTCALVLF